MAGLSHTHKKRRLFFPFFLAFILLSSTFAIVFSGYGENSSASQAGKEVIGTTTFFQRADGRWEGDVDGKPILVSFPPRSLSISTFEESVLSLGSITKMYIVVSPGEQYSFAVEDLYTSLKSSFGTVFLACREDGGGCENLPLKTCADATATTLVLSLEQSTEEAIPLLEGTCYRFVGTPTDIARQADSFLLSVFGVWGE